MKKNHLKMYIFALLATVALFLIAFGISVYINNKKTENLKSDEDKIAVNILSLETEYDLLTKSSCESFDSNALRQDLDTLSSKLSFMEDQLGSDNQDVLRLKRYYTILEIKDYLLMQNISKQCKTPLVSILYFYSEKDCPDCQTQDYLLGGIADEYGNSVAIYKFDYDIDLPVLKTLITLHNVPAKAPAYDINGKPYGTMSSLSDLENIVSPLLPQ